ncbi:MAG: hypothetical protein ABW007_04030, partial [Chitinophagaceae bacterium]
MNLLQEIKNLKKLLLGEQAPTELKKWSDSEIKVSDKAVGGKVELINADGSLSDAPDGDYELEDGTVLTVKGGVIEAVNGEKPEEAPAEEVEAAEETASDAPSEEAPAEDDKDQKIADLEAAVAALVQEISDIKSALSGSASKEDVQGFAKELGSLNAILAKLAKIPVESSKTNQDNRLKYQFEDSKMQLAAILAKK